MSAAHVATLCKCTVSLAAVRVRGHAESITSIPMTALACAVEINEHHVNIYWANL